MRREPAPILASRLAYNRAFYERYKANALTEEDRVRAVLEQYRPVKKLAQCDLVLTVPSNAAVAPGGQPEPSGLAGHGSLGD
jgi:hypothetical protein